jgi:hypothetical protein
MTGFPLVRVPMTKQKPKRDFDLLTLHNSLAIEVPE